MILNISVIQNFFVKFQISGHPPIDIFASIHNRQTQIFCTWFPHQQTYALDALSDSWDRIVLYAYPPICHIPKVLQHMRRFNCQVIHFDNATLAQKTLVNRSTPTRNRNTKNTSQIQNLLKQPNTEIKHPSRNTAVNCIVSIDRGFKEKGLSKLLSPSHSTASWRTGTQTDYACKFRQVDSWCSAREIDPYSASLVEIASYYSDLYTKVFNIGP